MLNDLIEKYSSSIDFREVMIYMVITAILSLLLSLVYLNTTEYRLGSRGIARVIPFISMTIALLSTVISGSAAIAIGLVGALSVVRYRIRIDNLEGLSHIFMAIALGLACGTGQPFIGLFGLVLFSLFLFIRKFLKPHRPDPFVLHISGSAGAGKGLHRIVQEHTNSPRLIHFQQDAKHEEWVFSFGLEGVSELARLKDAVSHHHESLTISLRDGDQKD